MILPHKGFGATAALQSRLMSDGTETEQLR